MPKLRKNEQEIRALEIAGVLAKYQKIRHVTNTEMARALGVSRATYDNRKRDGTEFRQIELMRAREFLGIPLEEMTTAVWGTKGG